MQVGHHKVGVVKANGEPRVGEDHAGWTSNGKEEEHAHSTKQGNVQDEAAMHIGAIQLASFIPVGTPMNIVAATK